ncbi:MAG: acylphosphatase [Bdellovibrionales bacterium]|nr:acylphosphatase [Bdellovibrionales bacterium]
MLQQKHYLISGKVQGVGFRIFVKSCAQKFPLLGWTRNLLDGRVEILAQGNESDLYQFQNQLLKGSPNSLVSFIEVKLVQTKIKMLGFTILEDGGTPWEEK